MQPWTRTRTQAAIWAAAVTLALAGLGGLATDIGPWYLALRQPTWKPPDLWFGPAWTLIYTLSAAAAVLCWEADSRAAWRSLLLKLFGLNAGLNLLWSVVFFRLHRPDLAFVEVVFLWLSIVALMRFAALRSRTAAWLLLPYLLWVSFAAALNAAVVKLNPPFHG